MMKGWYKEKLIKTMEVQIRRDRQSARAQGVRGAVRRGARLALN